MTNQNKRAIPGCKAMSKHGFWNLIAEVKAACGQEQDKYMDMLKNRLKEMGPDHAQDFHDIVHAYEKLAYKYGLWSAAELMGYISDDGFMDFRAWLIAQGKEVYLAALADPDSLADVEPYGGCQFESFSYVASEVLNTLTGGDAYDSMDPDGFDALVLELAKGIQYGKGIDYPYEWDELEQHFPRLCEKYLEPGTVEFMLDRGETIWFPDNEDIKEARAAGPPRQSASQFNIRMEGM